MTSTATPVPSPSDRSTWWRWWRQGRAAGAVAALALTTVLGAVGASPASATFPGSDGKVVFAGRDGNLWTATVGVGPGSYSERRLTGDGLHRSPRWSPDGSRIAFHTKAGRIGTMAADGTGRRIVVSSGRSYQPAWSPSRPGGQQLAFVRVPVGRPGDIWTVPAAGGTPRRLTYDGAATCGASRPSWSPAGSHLAYVRHNAGLDRQCRTDDDRHVVVVLDLATGARQVAPPFSSPGIGTYSYDGSRPDFTADGAAVVYLASTGCFDVVVQYDIDTRTQRPAHDNYACEGEPRLQAAVPTPSGGLATVSTSPGDPETSSTVVCLSTPSGGRCFDDVEDDHVGWIDIDVQPVRAG